jgi:hypothetical protein
VAKTGDRNARSELGSAECGLERGMKRVILVLITCPITFKILNPKSIGGKKKCSTL